MPSGMERNRQWGRGFCEVWGSVGVDTRIFGCIRGIYFWTVRAAGRGSGLTWIWLEVVSGGETLCGSWRTDALGARSRFLGCASEWQPERQGPGQGQRQIQGSLASL